MSTVNSLLFRFRLLIALICLMFVLYTNIFMWFYTPFTFHEYAWRPDSQAIISKVQVNSPISSSLEIGDRILQVNNQPVQRMHLMYPLPLQTEYTLTIQRGTVIQDVNVPISTQPNSLGIGYRLPAGIISLIGWLVGTIILRFAGRGNEQALHVGGIFLLAAVTIIGIQGALFGVPGTWVGGHPLVFFMSVGWLYLGTIPRAEPLLSRTRVIFKWLLVLAGMLAAAAVFEVVVLFPRTTSFQEITGISIYSLGLLLSSLSLIAAIVMIVVRVSRMSKSSYQRQQIRILAVFMAIGVLPSVILTIIPRALFDVVFLPFPVAISLLGFVPAGYFYIIYRRGFLGLDIIFSRAATFMILALFMILIYGTGLYVLYRQFNFNFDAIMPATLLFLPILFISVYSKGPIQKAVLSVFFGEVVHNQSIPVFASALSSKPEMTTLRSMVEHLVADFQAPQAILALKNQHGLFAPVALVNVQNAGQIQQMENFFQPLLRSGHVQNKPHSLFLVYEWAEILLPIIVREEQVGFLALARPLPDGYYNAEQVTFLSRVADMIAVGSEAISLFEASRKLSLELLSSREDERRHIVSNIHDGPMQSLIFITQGIRDIIHDSDCQPQMSLQLSEKATRLQSVIVELRETCAGLYPPFIDQGVKFVAETLTQRFRDEHNLNIQLTTPVLDDPMLSSKVSRTVYRVLLESLTNVVKHAQANNVCVDLDYTDDQVILSVTDDGVGCVLPNYSVSELIRSWHIGVVGMFEWAELVNGSLSLQQHEPHGTKVVLQIPIV